MFKQLYAGSSSACFELQNDSAYYNAQSYTVTVNGTEVKRVFSENVFSLFGLEPSKKYVIKTSLDSNFYEFTTSSESKCLDVRSFGAVGDGVANDWRAIQAAINCCPKDGRVVLKDGVFRSSPIVLKSDITLEICGGAKLLASCDIADYNIIPGEVECAANKYLLCSSFEGTPQACYQSFISAFHSENIRVVGEGEIDGDAQNGIWYIDCKAQKIGRPRLFFANCCTNLTIHGVTARNSASWTFHPFYSKNVDFFDIKVFADKDSPNTDGCNPESCSSVKIIGAVFSVGDDCVALKSGKLNTAKRHKAPCQDITVQNCLMMRGHGGVVFGSEMAGGIKNVAVTKCLFSKTEKGLRIKTCRGRGKDAIVSGVIFENIRMENVLVPLVINMFYFCDADGKREYIWSKGKLPIDSRTPYLGSFSFKNITCTECEIAAGFFYGLPERPIKQILIEDAFFSMKDGAKPGKAAMMSFAEDYCKEGLIFYNVDKVILKNVTFSGLLGEEVTQSDVKEVKRVYK